MPPKNTIELSTGSLYFTGVDEPLEVVDGSVTYEEEYAEDQEPYIKLSQEPVEFTLENAEFTKDWTLVECKECGYKFPVTELYTLLCGTKDWTCPRCIFNKAIEDARRRKTTC